MLVCLEGQHPGVTSLLLKRAGMRTSLVGLI